MRKIYLYAVSTIITFMGLASCQLDESINTTELDGNWFVNRIEMINAKSLDSENYATVNSKQYDVYDLKAGCLLFIVKETPDYNEYFVIEYKYDGEKWVNQNKGNVRLYGDNKFKFNNRQCKFKKGKGGLFEIKVQYGSEFYRYTLEKTHLKP